MGLLGLGKLFARLREDESGKAESYAQLVERLATSYDTEDGEVDSRAIAKTIAAAGKNSRDLEHDIAAARDRRRLAALADELDARTADRVRIAAEGREELRGLDTAIDLAAQELRAAQATRVERDARLRSDLAIADRAIEESRVARNRLERIDRENAGERFDPEECRVEVLAAVERVRAIQEKRGACEARLRQIGKLIESKRSVGGERTLTSEEITRCQHERSHERRALDSIDEQLAAATLAVDDARRAAELARVTPIEVEQSTHTEEAVQQ